MTEYNIFCRAEKYNDENSFQQKRYRIFNIEISRDEYSKIQVPTIKLEFDRKLSFDTRYLRAWNIARGKLSDNEKKQFTDLPHFNADIFEKITGIKVNEDVQAMTISDIEKLVGKKVKIIK